MGPFTFPVLNISYQNCDHGWLAIDGKSCPLGEFFGEIIEKHKLELDPLQPKDFIDVYLLEAEHNEEVISNQPEQPF